MHSEEYARHGDWLLPFTTLPWLKQRNEHPEFCSTGTMTILILLLGAAYTMNHPGRLTQSRSQSWKVLHALLPRKDGCLFIAMGMFSF